MISNITNTHQHLLLLIDQPFRRIDCESSGLKQKILLDVISLCLGSKDEFRSEVIREAISGLLDDPVPAQALMRTAILSGQVDLFWHSLCYSDTLSEAFFVCQFVHVSVVTMFTLLSSLVSTTNINSY